jgi:hypothetical protein
MENVLAQQSTLSVSTQTYVSAISSAAISRKFALQLEIAVGLAVYAEHGGTSREAKQALYQIYLAAGYDCSDQYGSSYKTVNRRINASGYLFDKLGISQVREWIAGGVEMQLINSIAGQLENFSFGSVNAVLEYVGRPVVSKRPEAFVVETVGEDGKPHTTTLTNTTPTIHEEPMDLMHTRLEEYAGPFHPELAPMPWWIPKWAGEEATQHVSLENVHIDISHEVSKDELIAAAMKLLAMANEMDNTPVPEVPEEIPKTVVVKPRRSKKVKDES